MQISFTLNGRPTTVDVEPATLVTELLRVQLFTGRPSRCTTQAPHWLVSQPIWVPVRLSCSRRSSATSVAGSTSTTVGRPLSVKDICTVILLCATGL